ncbi:hypothetical protein E2562_007100 [Oryza meyeriana var. granulata]|uniref:Uncharacterized protein n=1 Tax=Oryza meyeriana var. granulata TaxID=110450 RepID=A0A6G1F4W2_9ORYZ|nr:hypothetical protein E2562_007100 [Oryza meyeriana var. granulata]
MMALGLDERDGGEADGWAMGGVDNHDTGTANRGDAVDGGPLGSGIQRKGWWDRPVRLTADVEAGTVRPNHGAGRPVAVADCGDLRRLDAEAETTTGRTLAALQRRNGRGDA